MKTAFYILLFVLFPMLASSQNYAEKDFYLVDSLDLTTFTASDKELLEHSLKQYHSAIDDTTKVMAIKKITEEMLHKDWEKYQYFEYRLIQKSLQRNDISNLVKRKLLIFKSIALNNIGYIYDQKGFLDVALNYYKTSMKVSEFIKDTINICSSLNNVGLVYYNQGNIPAALKYFHKSLRIQERNKYEYGISAVCNNIAMIYYQQEDYELALNYNNKSLSIQSKIDDKRGMATSYNNIGAIYRKLENKNHSLEYFQKSAALQEEIMDYNGLATSLINLGQLYLEKGDKHLAQDYLKKSYELHQKTEDSHGMSVSLRNMGVLAFEQDNLAEAERFAKRAYQLAKETGVAIEIEGASGLLSKIYEKKGDYKLSFEMHKLHIKMRDSINNTEAQKATIQQEAKYRYEKQKTIDDVEYQKQLVIEQEAREKQQIITYGATGGLTLVGIFLVFVFNRLQITKRQKGIIEQQKIEVEQQKVIVDNKNKEITDSIIYAKRIQAAILPSLKQVKQHLNASFILYKPKDIVAGDFYWMENTGDTVLFAAADCTGHGVPGAMVSVVCNNGLNRSVREYGLTDPGAILDKTREIVIQEFEKSDEDVKDGMDIALCSLKLSESSKLSESCATLQYAGANNPLWIVRNGEVIEVKANKQPIGKYDGIKPYTTHTLAMKKNDTIYIFSDGFADQFGGGNGKKLKAANFKKLLLSIQNENMPKQKELLDKTFEDWKGNLEQLDDVCVVGVRV